MHPEVPLIFSEHLDLFIKHLADIAPGLTYPCCGSMLAWTGRPLRCYFLMVLGPRLSERGPIFLRIGPLYQDWPTSAVLLGKLTWRLRKILQLVAHPKILLRSSIGSGPASSGLAGSDQLVFDFRMDVVGQHRVCNIAPRPGIAMSDVATGHIR